MTVSFYLWVSYTEGEGGHLTLSVGESDRMIDCYLKEPAHERCRPSITSRAMLQLQSLSASMALTQNRAERTGEGMGGDETRGAPVYESARLNE